MKQLFTSLLLLASLSAGAQEPTVATRSFVARGSSVAYGRSDISGVSMADLQLHGFCYATHPLPTLDDHYATDYFDHNGRIYKMQGLTPSTKYYVRAFAKTKAGEVVYGDDVKIYTLPAGTITWQYDYSGTEEVNNRIAGAVGDAVDYWNRLTSIHGVNLNVHYASGTPTADCSYGGWMRVGPNASYQSTGTILHEALHAVGVGTHTVWYGETSCMRAGAGRGDWLGARATAMLRFLDNDNSAMLHGDTQHMWPYGINGAHEDNHTEQLYTFNGLLCQALGEDGLPPSGGFATPAYTLDQEDETKYYICSEDTRYGTGTGWLGINNMDQVHWIAADADEAQTNDRLAWTITFNPATCYYQLKNIGTGKYLAYDAAMGKFVQQTGAYNLQLMQGRKDVMLGGDKVRGYWLIAANDGAAPHCLAANANGLTKCETFDLGTGATQQRWVVLSADGLTATAAALEAAAAQQLGTAIDGAKALLQTAHSTTADTADDAFSTAIDAAESGDGKAKGRLDNLMAAVKTFLGKATPEDINKPFDITFMLSDAQIETTDGWSESQTVLNSCVEWTAKAFDFGQQIVSMPKGTYRFALQGFQRPGTAAAAIADYKAGTDNVAANIYIGSTTQKLANICSDPSRTKLGGAEVSMSGKYLPNNRLAARKYFDKGHYANSLTAQLASKGTLKFGVKCGSATANYWTALDNARLYFYGTLSADDVANGIETIAEPAAKEGATYNLGGTKVGRAQKGIYIQDGRKVIL